MYNNKLIHNLYNIFSSPPNHAEELKLEVAKLSSTLHEGFSSIESTQKAILASLSQMGKDISTLKKRHNCKEYKRKSLKEICSYDEQTSTH